ncbi:3-hydroxybutyryl-CoA dehydrogenase [Candidatus Moduliflexus flocculans]|uniref:3-hydroxybutyryl-CoA dehydrogenase n=1 Tax=Candidatus Moduliflexus flocculans TaxID=1499966 RepID=A0A081BPN3_9BACT|nr:3-hydroxybutyryl-CoA dehydrogenase [Candidatus Moduliflexus flocculans]
MKGETALQLNTIAIIGGGRVGSGIAVVTAKAGLTTILTEKTDELVEISRENIIREMDTQIARWGMTESEKKLVLANLKIGRDIEHSKDAQLVICAIHDDLEEQKDVFRRLNGLCQPDTIFSTNASVLSITELATVLNNPENMLGLHFLNPVLKTKLVEIVRGFKTSDATYEIGKKFIQSLGKRGIEVFESPGFVTTRLILPLINEAMYALMEGVASAEDIDTAMKLGYNMQMGPLEIADRMGLDRVLISMDHMFKESGDQKFRACPLIKKLVRAQHVGVKSGEGFFKYDLQSGKKLLTPLSF